MHKNSKKLVLISVLVICVIIVAGFIWIYESSKLGSTKYPSIDCIKDVNSRTLTVKSIDLGSYKDINWDDVKVSGNATIPTSGVIKVNDIIEDCSGEIVIVWELEKLVLYECEFPN